MLPYLHAFLLLPFLALPLTLLSSLRFQGFPSSTVFHCWVKRFHVWVFALPRLPQLLSPPSPQLKKYYQPQWLVRFVHLLALPITTPCIFLANMSITAMQPRTFSLLLRDRFPTEKRVIRTTLFPADAFIGRFIAWYYQLAVHISSYSPKDGLRVGCFLPKKIVVCFVELIKPSLVTISSTYFMSFTFPIFLERLRMRPFIVFIVIDIVVAMMRVVHCMLRVK